MTWLHWSLLSALFAGLTAILAKIGVAGVTATLATAIRTSVVVMLAWAIVLLDRDSGAAPVSRAAWVFLSLSGVATGLSWICYFRALQLGPASKVAPVDKLSVVFVILLAAVLLGERLTLMKIGGGLLIAAGAVLLAID